MKRTLLSVGGILLAMIGLAFVMPAVAKMRDTGALPTLGVALLLLGIALMLGGASALFYGVKVLASVGSRR